MQDMCGISAKDASFEDFQRLFKCTNEHAVYCNEKGLQFPNTCSFPPCNRCTVNESGKTLRTVAYGSKIDSFKFDIYY